MIKLLVLVKRPPTMTVEELRSWWLGPHAALAKRLPGLKRLVINLTVRTSDKEPEDDGMAEVWYDSLEARRKALTSPAGVELLKDEKEHGMTVTRLQVEEHVIV